jgi:hypothetical protein
MDCYSVNQENNRQSGIRRTMAVLPGTILFLLAGLTALFLLALLSQSRPATAQANSGHSVFLPLVMKPASPPPPASGALMFDLDSFRSASLAVDSQGKMHVAFSRIAPLLPDKAHAVFYGHCQPSQVDCGQVANWQVGEVDSLADGWPWVQLQVTADGRPRLLLTRALLTNSGSYRLLYRYVECDNNCALAQNWQAVDFNIVSTGTGWHSTEYSYHSFALDNVGRPRFIYEDVRDPYGDHYGVYYVFCDTHCAESGNWFETRIDSSGYQVYVDEHASLIFTADGRPRVFGRNGASHSHMVYVECNSNCDNSAGWSQPLPLHGTGHGSSERTWSPAVTANGGLRLTFYPRGGPFYYMWCNDNCTQLENWGEYSLEFDESGTGDYSALALDSHGRPHIALRNWYGFNLSYLWCSAECETLNAQWHMSMVEPIGQLSEDNPISPLPTCIRGSWFGGLRPVIALDAQDNPRLAYDAEYKMECLKNPGNPNDPSTYIETKWWTTRFVFFPRPEAAAGTNRAQPVVLLVDQTR